MKIWSHSFRDGAAIPGDNAFAVPDAVSHVRFAGNRNPHLAWDDIPPGTASLVLLVIDGDAPTVGTDVNKEGRALPVELPRGDFYHWALVDIPPDLTTLAEGAYSSGVTAHGKPGPAIAGSPMRQGLNDYTAWFAQDPEMAGDYFGYDGPCPPWNDLRVHHYIYRLYALDIERLPVSGRFTAQDVLAAMHGHIVDEAQLIGSYTLRRA
ncbi:YbhB/YbcL family Raf kinase inhibitor-like protein [Pseudoduganella plicata]|uniref:Phosphatidylethanolamine-binding protein n=1 Tax=Pseudoduganella plicata TaxID=321984 RepID=A0A4P7BHJ9_9BURK|nr:YbhB/YbcL family Raf kinase inhibitor-like protein [Pseudoduganella plicata]QBQ38264.1 YbhB/YbcL family Raf kinase inhibitor-like protein [Pseudoduganella plicata]GGY80671.1 phosphatidylethanolamine-binding protein [Pseudoduganella plicata]